MTSNVENPSGSAITSEIAKAFIDKAHIKFHDEGSIEIDNDSDDPLAQVSTAETVTALKENGGLYVKAWVWVPLDEISEEQRRMVGLED